MTSTDHGLRLHWLTIIGLGGILLFGGTALVLNVIAWPQTVPGLAGWVIASLAVACFLLAFSMWEHLKRYFQDRAWGKLLGAAVLFAVALGTDAFGTHRGAEIVTAEWRHSLQAQAEQERRSEQAALDNQRAALLDTITTLQARIDAVPLDLSGGPQNDATAQAAWNTLTAHDRQQRDLKQTRLDAMATVATVAPRDAWLTPMLWGFSLFAEYLIAFGVSICGIEIPGTASFAKPKQKTSARPPTPPRKRSKKVSQPKPSQVSHDGVIDLGTERAARDKRDAETVQRMTAEGMSFRDIERETNKQISRSRAQRLLNAR